MLTVGYEVSVVRSAFSRIVFGVLTAFVSAPSFAAAESACQSDIEQQLKSLIRSADGLHNSFASRSESNMQSSLDNLVLNIDCSIQLSRAMKIHERQHLVTVLYGIRDGALRTKKLSGEPRELQAQDVFRQLTHMTRIYNLIGAYQVYFCGKDRAFWLQSPRRAVVNPIHPSEKCAVRITEHPTTALTHAE